MNIELKAIKYAAFASQETACFNAAIWIDGKKAGTVENEGHGGPDLFTPHSLEGKIDAYAKSLPQESLDMGGGEIELLDQSASSIVGKLLDAWLQAKDFRRAISKRILYTKADGKIYQTKPIPPADMAKLLASPDRLKAAWKAEAILNAMPEAEALAIYSRS